MITLFSGNPGNGKTLACVRAVYSEFLLGRKVYSNIPLKFPHERYSSLTELVGAEEGVILMDEAQSYFDARQWDNVPVELRMKLQQHRKQALDVFATSQHPAFLEPTFRRLVAEFWFCRKVIGSKWPPKSKKDAIKPWGVIMLSRVSMEDIMRDKEVPRREGMEFFLLSSSLTELYDTRFVVQPLERDDVISEVFKYKVCSLGHKHKVT